MRATTLAVLPFENLSGDPEQGYFARGFVDDLLTELSRFPSLEVVRAHTRILLHMCQPRVRGSPAATNARCALSAMK